MNNLKVINKNGINGMDSREVAILTDKRHDHLMRDIKGYSEIMQNFNAPNFGVVEFFVESTYLDSKGEERPCYLITKKGCEMIANKMTGEKGVLFTATYVTKFNELEQQQSNQLDVTKLPKELQMFNQLFNSLAQTHLETMKLTNEIESMKQSFGEVKTLLSDRQDDWSQWLKTMFNQAVERKGDTSSQGYSNLRNETYRILESRASCDLSARQRNARERLQKEGATKAKIADVSKLKVIESDNRLKEIYTAIIKEICISLTN